MKRLTKRFPNWLGWLLIALGGISAAIALGPGLAVVKRSGEKLPTLASEAATTSMPIVRHLMLMFPDDVESRSIDDQFLLGPDLLVAPVVTQGSTSRSVYLPPGRWFHVWSGERYDGPTTVDVAARIGEPPVFSRDADRSDLRQAG